MSGFTPASTGFCGKLPARGDFVRQGLTPRQLDIWDQWCQAVIAGSRAVLAEDWRPAWLAAPVWHFFLAEGICGDAAAVGVWLPSLDKVGRYFPLSLFAQGERAILAQAGGWLDQAQAAGLAAILDDLPPEQLAPRLEQPSAARAVALPADAGATKWWTAGGSRVPAQERLFSGLPSAEDFCFMIADATTSSAGG